MPTTYPFDAAVTESSISSRRKKRSTLGNAVSLPKNLETSSSLLTGCSEI